jgi:hypothetical protein
MSNDLQEMIESTGLARWRVQWQLANEDCPLDFPEKSLEDVMQITLGHIISRWEPDTTSSILRGEMVTNISFMSK